MKELVKKYRRLCDEDYESKFWSIGNIALMSILILCSYALITFIVYKLTGSKIIIMLFPFLFAFTIPAMPTLFISLDERFCEKTKIIKKMTETFKGSINELFDLNDVYVYHVLKENSKNIEANIFANNGLSRGMIVKLIEEISFYQKLEEKRNREDEEKNALINANTKIGNMFQEIRSL